MSGGADNVGSRASAANRFAVLSDESLTEYDGEDWDDLCVLIDSSSMDVSSNGFVRDYHVDEIDEDE